MEIFFCGCRADAGGLSPSPRQTGRGPGRGACFSRTLDGLFVRRNKSLLLRILHNLHAACPVLQSIPNGEQTAFSVFSPLVIPKSQFFNVLFLQKCAALLVVLHLLRHTVLKTVKLHIQPGGGAVKIQNINSRWMLSVKFESGEAVASQCAPQFLFFVSLVATKLAGGLDWAHFERMRVVGKISSPCTLTTHSPRLARRGRRFSRS